MSTPVYWTNDRLYHYFWGFWMGAVVGIAATVIAEVCR